MLIGTLILGARRFCSFFLSYLRTPTGADCGPCFTEEETEAQDPVSVHTIPPGQGLCPALQYPSTVCGGWGGVVSLLTPLPLTQPGSQAEMGTGPVPCRVSRAQLELRLLKAARACSCH